MLKVAGQPLLDSIIERLRDQGFSRFRLAVNYLAGVIVDHFGNGSAMGVEIEYLRENHPRSTAGALSLLDEPVRAPIVVLNGDVLTRLAFSDLIDFHQENGAVATLCVREHQFQAPHGVAEIDGVRLTSLREKPTFRWQANAEIMAWTERCCRGFWPGHPRHARTPVRAGRRRRDRLRVPHARILAGYRTPTEFRERPGRRRGDRARPQSRQVDLRSSSHDIRCANAKRDLIALLAQATSPVG